MKKEGHAAAAGVPFLNAPSECNSHAGAVRVHMAPDEEFRNSSGVSRRRHVLMPNGQGRFSDANIRVVFVIVGVLVAAPMRPAAQTQVQLVGYRRRHAWRATGWRDSHAVCERDRRFRTARAAATGRFRFQRPRARPLPGAGEHARLSVEDERGRVRRPGWPRHHRDRARVGPLQQDVVVTAGATEQLQARTGAPVTVIDSETIEAINKLDVLEALRLVPAAQIVQVGQRGGATSLFLRGGESNFTKVLIDGIPANDIGGGFDFSQLTLGERRAYRGAAPDQ